MKSYYLMINLLIMFYQFSIQLTSQNELTDWRREVNLIEDYDISDLTDSMENEQYFKESNLNPINPFIAIKTSNWVKMKDLKILSFSRYRLTTGKNNLKQLNCLNNDELCDFGPDFVTCHIQQHLRSAGEFSKYYHCTAILLSNIQFERFNITCDKKIDNDNEEDIENVQVLKGSCFLNYRLKKVDYVLFYLKFFIAILCFIFALVLMIYTFSNCRNPERGHRIFLTPFYFTQSTLTHVSSSNTLYY